MCSLQVDGNFSGKNVFSSDKCQSLKLTLFMGTYKFQ